MDAWVPLLIAAVLTVVLLCGLLGIQALVRRLFPPKHPLQPGGEKDYRDVEGMNRLSGPPGGV
jgi:hypothetical protein